jgi:hypothetical protein
MYREILMMYHRQLAVLLLLLLVIPQGGAAAMVHRELSLQGMTGLLNTPNALLAEPGSVDLGYSNQIESQWRDHVPWQDNYFVSFGLLPYIEAGARLSEAPGEARDLSASAKVQLPLLPEGWPLLAVGIQDVGGGAPHFRSRYLVASQTPFSWLRLSLGYGFGPDQLDGVFAGGELQLADWLQLVGEHDGHEAAAGLRLTTPQALFPWPLRLGFIAKSPLADSGNINVGLTLTLPLGSDPGAKFCPLEKSVLGRAIPPVVNSAAAPMSKKDPPPTSSDPAFARLQQALVAEGFEVVRVGLRDRRILLVEFENSLFNRDETDALGLVLGMTLEIAPAGIDGFALRLLNGGLAVVEMRGPVEPFREAFRQRECPPPGRFRVLQSLLQAEVAPVAVGQEVWATAVGNSRWLHDSMVVAPGLATGVGTEFGVFDYQLSLRPDNYLQLWPGASLRLLVDIPVAWSDDYEPGGAFNSTDNNAPTLERILFNQAWHPLRGVLTLFSVGQFREELVGGINETVWSAPDGRHQLRLKAGLFEAENAARHSSLLGTYRYDWPETAMQFEGTAGRFFEGDKGFIVEARRFFGDTAIGFFYSDTDFKIGGIKISLPITPRRDMTPAPLQIRGTAQWDYRLQSTLVDKGGRNTLASSSGVFPQTEYTLERDFLNRDRFSEAYLRNHLSRMLEAYRKYRE